MKKSERYFLAAGLLTALFLAFMVSPFASKAPDGLERVSENHGFNIQSGPAWHSSLIPDYVFPGIKNRILAKGLAGVAGTLCVFIIGFLFSYIIDRRKKGKLSIVKRIKEEQPETGHAGMPEGNDNRNR